MPPLEADVVTAANEALNSTVERIMLSPYGDLQHAGGRQRFQKADAEVVIQEFQSTIGTAACPVGTPIYIGHPYHKAFKDVDEDTRAYGRVKRLEAGEAGLFAKVRWSAPGRELVEQGMFSSLFVNWRMHFDPRENVWRPVSLKSAGLTNDANIPIFTIPHGR